MKRFFEFLNGLMLRKSTLIERLSPFTIAFSSVDSTLLTLGAMIGHSFHITLGVMAYKYGIWAFFLLLIGGLLIIASAMCYAELSSISPTAGTAYSYCYNTMGELIAFLVGWNMIMSYSLCVVMSCRYLSSFIDYNFFDERIEQAMKENLAITILENFKIINSYPDIMSVLILFIVTGLTISMVRDSIIANDALVGINLLTIVLIFIIYLFSNNYQKTKEHLIPKDISTLSFIFDGVIMGLGCFTGYDAAVCLGEETENPTVAIPKSVLLASKLALIIYCSVVILHCLSWPCDDIDPKGAFLYTMFKLKMSPANWICALGGIIGHLCSGHASMFLLTRLLYTMSQDGLLFRIFGQVYRNTNTPVISTFILIIPIGFLGMYLDVEYIKKLAHATGIISNQLIAICLLIRRYRCEAKIPVNDEENRWIPFNYPRSLKTPSEVTERISMLLIGILGT